MVFQNGPSFLPFLLLLPLFFPPPLISLSLPSFPLLSFLFLSFSLFFLSSSSIFVLYYSNKQDAMAKQTVLASAME